jgi:dienelactone hydrolase
VQRLAYPTSHGAVEGDLYRPPGRGPFPGLVVCLGVVPFGVDHPQIPRLGEALARSGFAALLYWSPHMRDFRLDPADIEDIALAYEALLAQPLIDPARSGLLGTCVGGAFALMAASSARIRERVAFVLAYAAYASVESLMRDVASASRGPVGSREAWAADPLTRKVFLHSLTAQLAPPEAQRLRDAYATRHPTVEVAALSHEGHVIEPLLTALDQTAATRALERLPATVRARLRELSPAAHVDRLLAPLVILLHDREDPVIPVGVSRRLRSLLAQQAGLRYTEFTVFRHLDPTKGQPRPLPLALELVRFARAVYPVFRRIVAPR